MQTYEIRNILILNPRGLGKAESLKLQKAFEDMGSRDFGSLFEECGIYPDQPIREQEPKPLNDRKKLDNLVFDALGLTENERGEVYWSVCELVKNRLEKAESLKEEKNE